MTLINDTDKVALSARNVSWDWTGLPMHYVDGNPFATHYCNGMNMLLPEGEVFFVDVFSKALPLIVDEAVREDVIGFIGQEATHSSSHQSLLDHLQQQGLRVEPYLDQVRWFFRQLFGDRNFTGRRKQAWLLERVAIVAALEHFTSYLGNWGLNARGWDHTIEPRVLDLFRWHLAEEVEHRHVAYELYTHLDGRYWRRVRAWFLAAPTLAILWIRGIRYLMSVDPELADHDRRIRFRDVRSAWRRGLMPSPASLAAMFVEYLRPSYHPSRYGSTSQAVAYLASSPAARAAAH
ncbi:metal-dependent hydrolase [Nocardia neocaledoniensis]|uniref:metal-dependent hydrolase n=1 Tax=Nocardia neocaledoniensis TaxID=236511 RepID=UPI0024563B1C|nr:metal-dependent hydrolase [Nocardia neocaledoniensis]